MDAGTENVVVADMQKALRWYHGDSMSGERSVIVGSSHTNQVSNESFLVTTMFYTSDAALSP